MRRSGRTIPAYVLTHRGEAREAHVKETTLPDDPEMQRRHRAIRDELQEWGWIDGRTKGGFSQLMGRFAANCSLPTRAAEGIWPAVWMMPGLPLSYIYIFFFFFLPVLKKLEGIKS